MTENAPRELHPLEDLRPDHGMDLHLFELFRRQFAIRFVGTFFLPDFAALRGFRNLPRGDVEALARAVRAV